MNTSATSELKRSKNGSFKQTTQINNKSKKKERCLKQININAMVNIL